MSGKSLLRSTLVALSMLALLSSVSVSSAYAADATIDQVYAAAKSGKIDEAQTMMKQILQDHPKSGKAHFVEAELLAKQGLLSTAEVELATADRLAPGLPFAKPVAVENLRNRIAHPTQHAGAVQTTTSMTNQSIQAPSHSSGMSTGSLLMVLLAFGAFVMFVVRFMSRRNTVYMPMNNASGVAGVPGFGTGGGMPMQSYGSGMPMGMPMGGQVGGGMGSGIMGGLATGAAVGAGMVAGEALMHHFTDSDRSSRGNESFGNRDDSRYDNNNYTAPPNDMGGTDFGLTDTSSWDDNSGGGDSGGGDWD
jgi:hypothetical protein